MTEQSRVTYIDLAKAIGIYLVILGHVVNVGTPVKTILYTFHMPLFFILSGMTYKWSSNNSWQTIKERLTRNASVLLIPYLLFALIYSKLTFPNLAYIGYSSWKTLRMAGSLSSLWFLMALFMSHVYLLVIFKLLPKKHEANTLVLVIIAIALLAIGVLLPYGGKYGYPWMVNVAFVGSAFMVFGMLFRKGVNKLVGLKLAWRWSVLIVVMVFFILMIPVNHPSPSYVLMADGLYGNALYFTLTALLGSAVVILFSQITDSMFSRMSFVLWVGKNTLGIFLIHKFIVGGAQTIISNSGLDYNNVAIACTTSVIVLLVSCVVVILINKFIPFLLHYEKR